MQAEAYELLSLGMRYWFALLAVVIVFRSARLAWHDHIMHLRTMTELPDAGMAGELVNLENGQSIPLPREGVIGSGRSCDIKLKGVRSREIEFILKEGTGLRLIPCHMKHRVSLDGRNLVSHNYALHGSMLSMPGHIMRFRFFAGLDVPAARPADDPAPDAQYGQNGDFDMSSLSVFDPYSSLHEIEVPSVDAFGEQSSFQDAARDEVTPNQPDMTWMYLVPPAADVHTQEAPAIFEDEHPSASGRSRRRLLRSKRREN